MPETSFSATLVAEDQRMNALPAHFGNLMMVVENAIYNYMRHLCPDYKGGYWEYYEVPAEDDGQCGFYMAPRMQPKLVRILVDGNGFDGLVTPGAAGIVACLFAFSELANRTNDDRLIEHYQRLRDWVAQSGHPEAGAIYTAID